MKMVILLKGGEAHEFVVSSFSLRTGQLTGEIQGISWEQPEDAPAKLHYIDVEQIAGVWEATE